MELYAGFRYNFSTTHGAFEATVASSTFGVIQLSAEESNGATGVLYSSILEATALYQDDFKAFSDKKRKKLADSGQAMKDGSFPIENGGDLHNAIQAIGRAKDPSAAKAHIVKQARALKMTDQLPEDWDGSTKNVTAAAPAPLEFSVRERVHALVASL